MIKDLARLDPTVWVTVGTPAYRYDPSADDNVLKIEDG
jgi:hypothetical protein